MDPIIVGIIGLAVLFFLLIVIGMPIGACMILIGFAGFWYLMSANSAFGKLAIVPFDTLTNYALAVIPLFVLMATIITNAGFGKDLYIVAAKWLGHLPGGLAIATVWGCAILGAISPSSLAAISVMSLMAFPEMMRYGYDKKLATGTIAAGASLGPLIPPSGTAIIFGVMTGISIGKLFIALIIPGLILASLFTIVILILCWKNSKLGPGAPATSFKEKLTSIAGCGEVIVLVFLVLGGLLIGWFTPNEAGAVGAFGAIVIALARRRLTWEIIRRSFRDAFRITGMIYTVLIGAMLFSFFISVTDLPFQLSEVMNTLPLPPKAILVVILLTYIILGCLMDVPAMIAITIPIFFPVVVALGFSPIGFGVIVALVCEIGAITPPVAMNAWTLSTILKGKVSIGTIYEGIFPFLACEVILAGFLIFVPDVALILPGFMK
jgi:C4-dicarboxylate transporter, DctM subunit